MKFKKLIVNNNLQVIYAIQHMLDTGRLGRGKYRIKINNERNQSNE